MGRSSIDWLNVGGSIASLVGLPVALYTLFKVANLPSALKQHSREKQLIEVIDKVNKLPATRQTIPDSTAREIELFFIKIIRLYYVSRLPFRQRRLKSLLDTLEGEIRGDKQRALIQHQLRLIYNEITIR